MLLTFGFRDLMKEDLDNLGAVLNLIIVGALWYLIFYQVSYPFFMWNKHLKFFMKKY